MRIEVPRWSGVPVASHSRQSATRRHSQKFGVDCTCLSVPVPQVYALVRSGDLHAIKIGGRGVWRVDRAKLDAYLEQLEEQTADWAKAHPLNPREKAEPHPEELD